MSKKILIIDDEVNIAETLGDILELKGFEVKTANGGKQGFSMALNEMPDLILCDVMMPEMNGYEVLQAIRTHKETVQIPFVFLSAKDDRQDFRSGMNIGADDYLTKPVDLETLLHTISSRIHKHKTLLDVGHTEENRRVNKELHDTLQQTLLGLKMKLNRFREKNAKVIDITEIDESLSYIKLAFAQFRLILEHGPSFHTHEGFAECLRRLTHRVSGYVDFEISLQNKLTVEIPNDKADTLFSLLLEVLNNAIKHAHAKKLFIYITNEGKEICLVVLDDGVGFDPKQTNKGNGLHNMRERTRELNGTINIESAPGNGTTIEIVFQAE